jgi:GH35 family endo-1,4-beta-xylanase
VDRAFAYATEACTQFGKKPVLYINDYNLETDPGKRTALCNYAKGNPQVTGVASQMHLDMSTPDLKGKIEASLKDLTATGKMVRIAELDLKNQSEEDQADIFLFIFQKYLEIVPLAQRGGITFWGINDKDSWVGEGNHPLVWKGNNYEKKEAYKSLYIYLCELNGISPYKE